MMRHIGFVGNSSIRVVARWTRWFRRRVRGGKISPKAVALRLLRRRRSCACSIRRGRALKNCCSITKISCGTGVFRSWTVNSPEALAVRGVPKRADRSDLTNLTDQERWALYGRWLDHADPAVRANATICLIHQTNYLLDQQIAALEKAFIEDGGYSEQLATARLAERQKRKDQPERIPACPQCGKPTVLRTAKSGKNSGRQFWGCSCYPDCKGVVSL
jgi:four helix bundle suffix protein